MYKIYKVIITGDKCKMVNTDRHKQKEKQTKQKMWIILTIYVVVNRPIRNNLGYAIIILY